MINIQQQYIIIFEGNFFLGYFYNHPCPHLVKLGLGLDLLLTTTTIYYYYYYIIIFFLFFYNYYYYYYLLLLLLILFFWCWQLERFRPPLLPLMGPDDASKRR